MIYSKHGIIVRSTYLLIACVWYLVTLAGRLRYGKSLFLCYHGISLDQQRQFKWQMSHLASLRRNTPEQNKTLKVDVTFDDAFENLLNNALPILEKFQIPAIIFAVPKNLGTTPQWNVAPDHPDYHERVMTAEQIVSLSNHPTIHIGSHTLTHPNLAKLKPQDIKVELLESKIYLKKLLGYNIDNVALPHGSYNQTVLAIAQEVGYKKIYTLDPMLHCNASVENIIGRFSMSPDVWKIEFILTCAGAYSWLLPFRFFVKRIRQIVKGN
jgi:peptidoglycan/xylan/chitin deacetylase (PgdA/CDA1 family)